MTESEAYVAFNLTERVGFATAGRLKEEFGSLSEAWARYPVKKSRTGGEADWEGEFRKARRLGVRIITPADDAYPAHLRATRGHPLALYVKGDVGALSALSVAMVGTRRATNYGLSAANRLSYDLAKSGWAVVSGLALGIDAESHRGALSAGGVTVGVIGSALDEFYPEENLPLAREIVNAGGAVVSQFPFGRGADRTTFPIRNHVVAALSRGVVAVEAPLNSGTMITASAAVELGRTVMALPARIDNRMSAGCLKLIRDGARLIRNVDDVMEEMSEYVPQLAGGDAVGERKDSEAGETRAGAYSAEEALLMLHVDEDGVSLDDIARKTGMDAAKVNSTAVMLRIRGFVEFLPGNRIALSTRPG